MAETIEQLSYQLAAEALAEQERTVSGLRSRAGTVLAAASIAGSFLAAKTSAGGLGVWGALALAAYVSCVAAGLWVLLPHNLVFAFRGRPLLWASDGADGLEVGEAYRVIGSWIQKPLERNREKIAELSVWFAVSCGMLAAEVILWTVSLTG